MILGLSEGEEVRTRNRYNLLYQSTLGTRVGFGCLLILHREVLQLCRCEVNSGLNSPEFDIFTLVVDDSSVLMAVEKRHSTQE